MKFGKKTINTQGGQAIMIAVVFFLIIIMTIVLALGSTVTRESREVRDLMKATQSFYLADSAIEDLAYRVVAELDIDLTEVLEIDGNFATTTLSESPSSLDPVYATTTANIDDFVRRGALGLLIGDGVAFTFGVQSGNGGFLMENSASIEGSLYSNGSVVGTGTGLIEGDVVSAGPSGLFNGAHATGTVYANTITNGTIDFDAYYKTISGSTVGGTLYPGSNDKPTTSLPISDSQINEWKQDAEDGGVTNCSGTMVFNTNQTIGPQKYTCDLEFTGNNKTTTLNGPIWATGNITFKTKPNIQQGAGLTYAVQMIADNPSNRATSSKISIENSTEFIGNATDNHYIMLISGNNSEESGGSEVAISLQNSATGDVLLYSNHGKVLIANSTTLKQVTAYRIHLKNTARLIYDTGLASSLFTSGPQGGYELAGWRSF